jgi:hypothetical protein
MIANLMNLVADNTVLFYFVVLISSISSSALGIGSFILIPIVALYIGAKASVGVLTIYFLVQNINKLIFFKGHANIDIAKIIILWAIPGVILGSILLGYVPDIYFEKILAIAILVFITNDIRNFFVGRRSEKGIPVFGLLYGFFSGLLGSGNLVKGPLFVSLGLLKESYIATYALTSLFMNLPKIGIYTWNGVINRESLIMAIPLVVISVIGTYLGKKAIKKVNTQLFYGIIVSFFIISAIILLLK